MAILGMSVWFWILMSIGFVLLIWCTESESPFWAATVAAVSALAAHFIFDASIFALILSNPLTALAALGGYLLAGVLWAFPKWWFYVRNKRNAYLEKVRNFLQSEGYQFWHDATTIPEQYLPSWFRQHGRRKRSIVPLARDHKSRILHWMAWWPFSMIWTLINDPIRHIYRWTWEALRGTFDSIARSAMGGIEAPQYVSPEPESVTIEDEDQKPIIYNSNT